MNATWIVFDLGNTLIKLAYERVIARICRRADVNRDALIDVLEQPGGYRDMERGAITFREFHDFLRDKAGFRGSLDELREIWTDFFDGTITGMEAIVEELRAKHRVAFLSNSNEVHEEVLPRRFGALFRRADRFLFSHRFRVAKPDPDCFLRALEVLDAEPHDVVFIDDLLENVLAARSLGMRAYQFSDAPTLRKQLEADGLM